MLKEKILGALYTSIIIIFLAVAVLYFYWARGKYFVDSFILNILLVTVIIDGLYFFIHIPRKPVVHGKQSFDSKKLTIIIACYNGQGVIGKTLEHALRKVPAQQIIVVSDASTDATAEVAKSYGVRVVENRRNLNKAFSVSRVIHLVKTPYVLVLDDDTLIGSTQIPTSLLDQGYSAVAFNVMPVYENTVLNKLQQYEYRKSMFIGKSLRGSVGAVGNISGAVGLYRTEDLLEQVTLHSGQFGGEDQQRTVFVHLLGKGRGITYTDEIVYTIAPNTLKSFFRQRSFRWNLSLPEMFVIYSKILFGSRFHYLLKIEKGYQMYLLLTDPFRMVFFWLALLYPVHLLILYFIYAALSYGVWLKVGKKDPWWIPIIFPALSAFESVCRFIAHFYWFKIKYSYLFRKKYHKLVAGRNLIAEYASVLVVLVVVWGMSISLARAMVPRQLERAPVTLAVYSALGKTSPYILDQIIAGTYDDENTDAPTTTVEIAALPVDMSSYSVTVESGDGKTHIARKAIVQYLQQNNLTLNISQLRFAEDSLQKQLVTKAYKTGEIISVPYVLVALAVESASKKI